MFRGYVSSKERKMFFQNISVYVQRQCLQTQKHKPYHLLQFTMWPKRNSPCFFGTGHIRLTLLDVTKYD